MPNLPPTADFPDFPLVFASGQNDSFAVPVTDPEGTTVTATASGLPPGVGLQVSDGEMVFFGEPLVTSGQYPVTITLTDADGEQTIYTIDMWVDEYGVSPLRGQLMLSEFMYHGQASDGVYDEYLELYNAGTEPIDLAGMQASKHSLLSGLAEDGVAAYTWPATDENGQPSILGPGERAVLWMWDSAVPATQPEELRYVANTAAPRDLFADAGDDIWLFDPDLRIIDYIAYDSNATGSRAIDPPSVVHEFWTGSDAHLGGALPGQSISRASGDATVSDPACWERTTTGDATCSDVVGTTLDEDPTARVASPGDANT